MGRADKRNRTKQIQRNRKEKLNKETDMFSKSGAHKIFTLIHLSPEPVDFGINLKYNCVVHQVNGFTPLEISYLARCSDLLLLTVGSATINQEMISLLKRFMPTSVIIYERKQKSVAKSVSRIFGEVSTCEVSMLTPFLNNLKTVNTSVCKNRPFMVANEFSFESGILHVQGFMKKGLQTERVVVNGICDGIVEEVRFGENVISGNELIRERDEVQIMNLDDVSDTLQDYDTPSDESPEHESSDSNSESEYDLESNEEDTLYNTMLPELDLIKKYEGYRGIRDLESPKLDNSGMPESYKDLVFLRSTEYMQRVLSKRESIIPPNTYVNLRIRLCGEITNPKYIILFGTYEFEDSPTIMNYEFMASKPIEKQTVVDNGFRIYHANTALSRNLSGAVFEENSKLTRGVASFVGPFSFFAPIAYFIDDEQAVRGCNGYSQNRMFFQRAVLTGRPMKIMKRHVVIRGMFHNDQQVSYFRNIKLEANHGNVGFIKKPLGTKGLFKAHFNKPLKHGDDIWISLYKRVFI